MKRKALFIASLSGTLLLLQSCENDIAQVRKFMPSEDITTETAHNVDILYSDSAVVRVRIKAPILQNVNDPQNPRKIFPKTISVDIFDQYRQPTSHIKALKAVRYENGSKVILQDSVRIWNVKNETMEGEEFVWDESNDKISSDGFVKVTTPSETIMGYGLDSNLDFTHWHLRLVTGHVQSSSMTK